MNPGTGLRSTRFARNLITCLLALPCLLRLGIGDLAAAVPSAEKLLPDDTLAVLTAPDFRKLRLAIEALPQSQFWNDPAMRPFRENFISKWNEDFVKPLERDLEVRLKDYISLPQGQFTLALIQNGPDAKEDQPLGFLLLLDANENSSQLGTNLAGFRRKWVEAGKALRTEKIRNVEFAILPMSTNEIPRTLNQFFPPTPEVQELGPDGEAKKSPRRPELVIGQADSLLIIGNSLKVVEKIVIRLTGGALPSLGELAAYDSCHQACFRQAPIYGWVNVKAWVDRRNRLSSERKEPDATDPFALPKPDKMLAATGLAGLKTIAFTAQNSNEGTLFQLFLSIPEAGRQGLFKVIAGEPKDCSPPAFVPADAVKFRRWRLDGQKAWAALEKMLTDLSPQSLSALNFIIDTANANANGKDPGFDVRKNLIGNLGDDIITYEKAPRGNSPAEIQSLPSLVLVASPNAEQFTAALKSILIFMSAQAGSPTEREFLGRKILSVPLPNIPLPLPESARSSIPRTLNYSFSGGYVALSTDPSMLEEYLRSSESQAKALRETSGLVDASQKVTGSGTGLFGYQNQTETLRTAFEELRHSAPSASNPPLFSPLPGAPASSATPEKSIRDWMDFSLLPPFDTVSKYFSFIVYGVSASVDGLTLKIFAPAPPGLKTTPPPTLAR